MLNIIAKINGMKILENNYDKFPREIECYDCRSIILLESEDDCVYQPENAYPDAVECYIWTCPLCKRKNYIHL